MFFAAQASAQHTPNSEKTWAWLDFVRPEGVNPVISPDTSSVFHCPMRGKTMRWEDSDTFNPAAAVINNSIAVLYRAEDNSAVGIGSRTSPRFCFPAVTHRLLPRMEAAVRTRAFA